MGTSYDLSGGSGNERTTTPDESSTYGTVGSGGALCGVRILGRAIVGRKRARTEHNQHGWYATDSHCLASSNE